MTSPVSNATGTAARVMSDAIAGVLGAQTQVAAALAGSLTRRSSSCGSWPVYSAGGCEIPPPCWEPQPAGTCSLELAPGTGGTIRVRVTNCGWTRQIVAITAPGRLAAWMTFTPTALILYPQERATLLVTLQVPAAVPIGRAFSTALVIRGCRDHFARIELAVGDCVGGARNCCDVCVDDCADQIHHWYDHFYCARPCNTVRPPDKRQSGNG